MKAPTHIKPLLESAYNAYHSNVERDQDPVAFPHRFHDPEDQVIVAFYSALLAYGNVKSILSSLRHVVEPLHQHPKDSILALGVKNPWEGFYHRFTTGEDLFIVGHWLKQALLTHRSLERFFMAPSHTPETSMRMMLSSFVSRLTKQKSPPFLRGVIGNRTRNLRYLLSDPMRGSACKRLNLFLRWVIRPKDGIDLGLWNMLKPSQLMLPIDTHLLKVIRKLGWSKTKVANWQTVEEATEVLKSICPEDPIRYDFSLCHLSMRGDTL